MPWSLRAHRRFQYFSFRFRSDRVLNDCQLLSLWRHMRVYTHARCDDQHAIFVFSRSSAVNWHVEECLWYSFSRVVFLLHTNHIVWFLGYYNNFGAVFVLPACTHSQNHLAEWKKKIISDWYDSARCTRRACLSCAHNNYQRYMKHTIPYILQRS